MSSIATVITGSLDLKILRILRAGLCSLLADLCIVVVAPVKPLCFMNVKFNHWSYSWHTPLNAQVYCKLYCLLAASPQVLVCQDNSQHT